MKYLQAPNGKRIVGTPESMLCMYSIDVHGKNPDGTIDFEYDGNVAKAYDDTAQQRKDRRGRRLFQDTDGVDWPEHKLTVQEEPAEATG